MDEDRCTGRVIRQRIAKNNRVIQKGKEPYGVRSTISQSFAQRLSTNLSPPYFKNLAVMMRSLFLFILQRLEQACLFNGAD